MDIKNNLKIFILGLFHKESLKISGSILFLFLILLGFGVKKLKMRNVPYTIIFASIVYLVMIFFICLCIGYLLYFHVISNFLKKYTFSIYIDNKLNKKKITYFSGLIYLFTALGLILNYYLILRILYTLGKKEKPILFILSYFTLPVVLTFFTYIVVTFFISLL